MVVGQKYNATMTSVCGQDRVEEEVKVLIVSPDFCG